jgi:hypothetical protein
VNFQLGQNRMTNKTKILKHDEVAPLGRGQSKRKMQLLRITGLLGLAISVPFFLWVPLGFIGLTPSLIDVFGLVGLRFPAAVTIAGLLLAAIGFHKI